MEKQKLKKDQIELKNSYFLKSEKSKDLLKEFRRFVEYFNPGYVVVENVPGVFRKKEESGLLTCLHLYQLLEYKTVKSAHPKGNLRNNFIKALANLNVYEMDTERKCEIIKMNKKRIQKRANPKRNKRY